MTYDELVAAVKAYADRNDIEVDNNMDVFILMAEARINRLLHIREQTHRMYTYTTDQEMFYSLPTDYSGMRTIKMNDKVPDGTEKSWPMTYYPPENFDERMLRPQDNTVIYTILASQIKVWPRPTGEETIEMVYYRKTPNLNATDNVNWLSEEHPDIYLAGMLAEVESFTKNYEVATAWDSKMSRSIDELDLHDEQERWTGSQMVTRIL